MPNVICVICKTDDIHHTGGLYCGCKPEVFNYKDATEDQLELIEKHRALEYKKSMGNISLNYINEDYFEDFKKSSKKRLNTA